MQKYSKDPKVFVVSIKEFFKQFNAFENVTKEMVANDDIIPKEFASYYRINEKHFINVFFTYKYTSYGLSTVPAIDSITVANRDGKTEYELFDKKIAQLEEKRQQNKRSKKIPQKIKQLIDLKNSIPPYKAEYDAQQVPFNNHIIDTGYKTDKKYKKKYLVVDVETNGLRKANDDLLSITIFDPFTGLAYNRFLPLDLQPLVLTSHINGIKDEQLKNQVHISQEEVDWLYDYFDLKNSVLLSYSGGKGLFDADFIKNYCKRNNLIGFEDLTYQNIKSELPKVPFGCEGQLSKDNLCRMLKINGVTECHSGLNDCILEWKLFETIGEQPLFFIDENMYRYNPQYIIPVTYLNKCPKLAEYANFEPPYILGYPELIFEYSFPEEILSKSKKFSTNITGITLEHAINSLLEVEKKDNCVFLSRNKSHLDYIARFRSDILDIPIVTKSDGTVESVRNEDAPLIENVNKVTKTIMKQLSSTIDFIKNDIFKNEKISSQELVISDDKKVLALCDLSSKSSVLEIKTYDTFQTDRFGTHLSLEASRQLFYQCKNRTVYLLQIVFHHHYLSYERITDGVCIKIYNIALKNIDKDTFNAYIPSVFDLALLELIKHKPKITYIELDSIFGRGKKYWSYKIQTLIENGFLEKENQSPRAKKIVTGKHKEYMPDFDVSTPVYVYNRAKLEMNSQKTPIPKKFQTITEAAENYNLPESVIFLLCNSKQRFHTEYVFSIEKLKPLLKK